MSFRPTAPPAPPHADLGAQLPTHSPACFSEGLLKPDTDQGQRRPSLTRDRALPASLEACSNQGYTASHASREAGATVQVTQAIHSCRRHSVETLGPACARALAKGREHGQAVSAVSSRLLHFFLFFLEYFRFWIFVLGMIDQ